MHAAAAARADALGMAAAGTDADDAVAMADGGGEEYGGGGLLPAPRSRFEHDIARARRGLGRMPAFMRSGLVSTEAGQGGAAAPGLGEDDASLRALASLPPGMLASRRAGAAATIAKARALGLVGGTVVQDRRAERRQAIELEIAEFNRQGDRVQKLADKLGAVSGAMETQQYGALLKPLFDNMGKLMERLNVTPDAAAAMHGVDAAAGPDAAAAEGAADPAVRRRFRSARSASPGAGGARFDPRDAAGSDPLMEPVDVSDLPEEYRRRLGAAAAVSAARLPPMTGQGRGIVRRRGASPPPSASAGALQPLSRSRHGSASSPGGGGAASPAHDPFVAAGRRVRAKRKQYASTIPWSLLDELEAEKDKLVEEQRRAERWGAGGRGEK